MAFIDMGDQFIALSSGRSQPPDSARHFGLVVDGKEAVREALRSAGAGLTRRSYAWLASQQNRDGGFGFSGAAPSDADDTGAALEALAGAPGLAAVRARAVAYLRGAQNRDGGFGSQAGEASNTQSTAWAIQGLDAAGVAPASFHRHGAVSPMGYLRGLVAPDGSVRYSRGMSQTPVWVTAEALMALEGKPLPLAPVPALAASWCH